MNDAFKGSIQGGQDARSAFETACMKFILSLRVIFDSDFFNFIGTNEYYIIIICICIVCLMALPIVICFIRDNNMSKKRK